MAKTPRKTKTARKLKSPKPGRTSVASPRRRSVKRTKRPAFRESVGLLREPFRPNAPLIRASGTRDIATGERHITIGSGSIVLSSGRAVPIHVQVMVEGSALSTGEQDQLQTMLSPLHDLSWTAFRGEPHANSSSKDARRGKRS